MAELDPIASASTALIEAALSLGIPAEVLQAQISVGDLLAATVLVPQNGQDLIEILGQTVVAKLPPDVHPGETLVLQVTGLSGNQILVRNLGLLDERNPAVLANVVLDAPAQESAVLTSQTTAQQAPAPVSPPREVFVAASVLPQPRPANAGLPQARLIPAPLQIASIDARIAAAQTTRTFVPPESPLQTTPAQTIPARAAPTAPAITPRAAVTSPAAQSSSQTPVPAQARTAAAQITRTVSDLLRSVGVADTPLTRTAAAIAPQAPLRLPSVLARLEKALEPIVQDARAATLRTIAGFTARLNLANPETLPSQISAYISHVIEGAEAKLSQLLQAYVASEEPQPGTVASQTGSLGASAPAAEPDAAAPPASVPLPQAGGAATHAGTAHTVAAARVAERTAASEHDLKTIVLSLLRDPPAGRTPTVVQALNESLITLTATQLNVLSANTAAPGTTAIPLPAFFYEAGKPAYLRISRDGTGSRAKMDADNFHVAFVLDTENLGTVAVDLQTSGRAVNVEVKTERAAAASAFSRTLGTLRDRLEHLQYRVSSAVASALPVGEPAPVTAPPGAGASSANVDLRA